MLAEVEIESLSDILTLKQIGADILSERAMISPLPVIITEAQLRTLKEYGWEVTILNEDLVRHFDEKVNKDGKLGAYHTYDEMLQAMQKIADLHPDIARLVDIGDSWEKTQGIADRDIWAMKISDNPFVEEADEPDVLIMGCHHARELISVEIPLAIIRFLTKRYSQDYHVDLLVDTREIWIVPMVNPDGHVYVEEVDPMWRKNRNTNGSGDPYYQGVDLNRNYGFQWGYDDFGSSPYASASDYRGTAPFSEPETRAIRDLAESRDFVLSLSYHSFGDLFLFPWCFAGEDTDDDGAYRKLGRNYTRKNGYIYGNVRDGLIYSTNGDTDDWMYGEQLTKNKIFGATVEVGYMFQPPESEIPGLILENLKPALLMIRLADRL